jgi:LPXTG-site transpeptidase (sortase) family protein
MQNFHSRHQNSRNDEDTLESYLLNLPKEDRSRDEYIVLPSNGMITPINTVQDGTPDYKKLVSGREIDVNKYLKTGVVTYPGTNNAGFGGIGNTVIFGHSSYWKSDSGRYKTHFQKIIELEEGEEIWVYKKQEDGTYRRYRYVTTTSSEVKANDVSVLAPGIGKNLTLFTCTPIGGITGRWIVKAKYLDEEKISLENKLYGKLLTSSQNKEIQTYFQSLKSLSVSEKKSNLEKKYLAVSAEKHTAFTEYFLMQIAKSYAELK